MTDQNPTVNLAIASEVDGYIAGYYVLNDESQQLYQESDCRDYWEFFTHYEDDLIRFNTIKDLVAYLGANNLTIGEEFGVVCH